jgi:hypothetical protein
MAIDLWKTNLRIIPRKRGIVSRSEYDWLLNSRILPALRSRQSMIWALRQISPVVPEPVTRFRTVTAHTWQSASGGKITPSRKGGELS